jgi:ABC-2 type transport system permease protein
MADVVTPGIGRQVLLVAGLRWRVFRNSLRTTRDWLDLAAIALTTALGALFVGGVGLGLGAAAYALVHRDAPEFLALPLLAVFLFWQFVPLLLASSATGFDFRHLLRFPLRFPAFFLVSLAYALFDPAAIGSLVWLGSIAAGITTARPELLPWTLLVLAVFAAANLLLSRMVFAWLERLLARRRSREALVAFFLLCVLSLQLFSAVGARWEKRMKPHAAAALPLLQLFPPGLAGKALAAAARGNAATILLSTALLAAYGLAFGLLLDRRLRRQYLGEDLGESAAAIPAAAVSSTSSASSTSLASSFLPGAVAAVFEKELHYLYRNSVQWLNLLVPLILIIFFSISSSPSRHRAGAFTRSPELAFPAAVAYMFLILTPLVHNSFAFDGRGIQLLYVTPVRFRDVLLGKNLVFGLILIGETVVVWLLVALLFRPPGAMIVVATFCGLLFAALVHFIVGNWLSLQFPRRFEFGQFRRRASGVSVLLGLGLQVGLLGFVAGVVLLARWRGQMWIVPVVFLTLAGLGLPMYRAALDRYTRLALDQREVLTSQLCR